MQSKLPKNLLLESRVTFISNARNISKRSVFGGKLKYFLTVWSRFVARLQIRPTSLINEFVCAMRGKALKIVQDAGTNGLRSAQYLIEQRRYD